MDYLTAPLTTADYHLWQALGLTVCLLIAGICLSINRQAILESQAFQKGLLHKKQALHLQDRGHPGVLPPLPGLAFDKPVTRRHLRRRWLKALIARLILPVMALLKLPIHHPTVYTYMKGNRRP